MAKIEGSIEYIWQNEGGYVNNPHDPGGATNWGITISTLGLWHHNRATVEEVKALTKKEAIEIYRAFYWNACQLDSVLNQAMATSIFDVAVNRGVGVAKQYVAETCTHFGFHLSGINMLDAAKFIEWFEARVEQGYKSIVLHKPSSGIFLKGWLRRARRMLGLIKRG